VSAKRESDTISTSIHAACTRIDSRITRFFLGDPKYNSTQYSVPHIPTYINMQIITLGSPKLSNQKLNEFPLNLTTHWKFLHESGAHASTWRRAKQAAYWAYYETEGFHRHQETGRVARYKNLNDKVCKSPPIADWFANPPDVIWLTPDDNE
jgi:hypothetical protein